MKTFFSAFALAAAFLVFAGGIDAQVSTTATDARALFDRATAKYERREYDAAIADYNEYLRLRPGDSSGWFNRGLAHYYRSMASPNEAGYRRAAADLSEAIKLDPSLAAAWRMRGNVHLELLKVDMKNSRPQAIADFTQAIRLDPRDAAAYRGRGTAYREGAEYQKAIADLNNAIRLDPKDATAHYIRSQAYTYSRRLAEAKADAETAIRLFPNYDAAKILLDYINGEIAKGATATARATPTPRATPRPAPARTTARTTTPAPRPTPRPAPPTPEQDSAAMNDPSLVFKKADDAANINDHKAVIAYTTRYLQLSPLNRDRGTMDDLMRSFYISSLHKRARAHAALKNNAASDADYEAAAKAAMDISTFHLQGVSAILDRGGVRGNLAALLEADFEMEKAMSVCRRSVEIADEWRITANAAQPTGMSGVRAGIVLMGARELCVPIHIDRAKAVAAGRAFQTPAQKAENSRKAIEILTTAINFANFYPRLYEERAKLYRAAGRNDLAAADEAKVRELAAPKPN